MHKQYSLTYYDSPACVKQSVISHVTLTCLYATEKSTNVRGYQNIKTPEG